MMSAHGIAAVIRVVPLPVTTETVYPIIKYFTGCAGSSSQSERLLLDSKLVQNGKASVSQLTKILPSTACNR